MTSVIVSVNPCQFGQCGKASEQSSLAFSPPWHNTGMKARPALFFPGYCLKRHFNTYSKWKVALTGVKLLQDVTLSFQQSTWTAIWNLNPLPHPTRHQQQLHRMPTEVKWGAIKVLPADILRWHAHFVIALVISEWALQLKTPAAGHLGLKPQETPP